MNEAIKPVGMPKWGLAMTEGKLTAWLVQEGARVQAGEEICEIETSKITNVFESPVEGVLRRHAAQEGDTLPVGALIAVVTDGEVSDVEIDAYVADARARQAEQAAAPPPPEPVLTPASGWNVRALRTGGGEGVPLLLIHGFGGDLLSWQFNQPALSEARPVVAIDLPGHGGSSKIVQDGSLTALASMVAAAMDALELPRAHVAGHSLGGAIALQLALDHPGRVASVTLVCPAGLGEEINAGYIEGFITADRRKDLKAVVEQLFANPEIVTRDMVEDLLRYKRLDGVGEALRGIAGAVFAGGRQSIALAPRLTEITVPLQVIWGEEDKIIPARHATAIPSERRHVIGGTGHMVHLEKPEAVNDVIAKFTAAVA